MSHWYLINSRLRRGGAFESSFALTIIAPTSPQFAAGAEHEPGAPGRSPGSETAAQTPRGQAGPTTQGSCWWLSGQECEGLSRQSAGGAVTCKRNFCVQLSRADAQVQKGPWDQLSGCVLGAHNIHDQYSRVQIHACFYGGHTSVFSTLNVASAHSPGQPASLGWG